jgi:hypothetical protein
MTELVKETFQYAIWLVAIATGGIAAFKAIHEFREGTRQRHQELRWRRAKAAREILHEIHVHELAASAVTMLDWSNGQHQYKYGGLQLRISYADVLSALGKIPKECSDERDIFIRDCFDWFFYHIDRIEHAIRTEYIDFVDVESVFRPYARKVRAEWSVFDAFITSCEYPYARDFFLRYPAT